MEIGERRVCDMHTLAKPIRVIVVADAVTPAKKSVRGEAEWKGAK